MREVRAVDDLRQDEEERGIEKAIEDEAVDTAVVGFCFDAARRVLAQVGKGGVVQRRFVSDTEFAQLAAVHIAEGVAGVQHIDEMDVAGERLVQDFVGVSAAVAPHRFRRFQPGIGFDVGEYLAGVRRGGAFRHLVENVQAGVYEGVQRARFVLVFLPDGIEVGGVFVVICAAEANAAAGEIFAPVDFYAVAAFTRAVGEVFGEGAPVERGLFAEEFAEDTHKELRGYTGCGRQIA